MYNVIKTIKKMTFYNNIKEKEQQHYEIVWKKKLNFDLSLFHSHSHQYTMRKVSILFLVVKIFYHRQHLF